ncbi:STAS domain-containing protein [Streptomyces sp. Tu 3180]|uniref:STAS domain-containing protein n=1 Tax=Streptomyces sp. Tu 3180 TaxID=2682611 RepID=UPI001FB5831F|nr:STAS domain-containing protein [Streptomyces sp. Tu 3180]
MSAVTFLSPSPSEPRDPSERVLFPFPPEIDFSTASGLLPLIVSRTRTRPGGPPQVLVLDLTPTHFMDSQGVRLINEVRLLLRPGTRVHVVALPDGLASRVLELTGLRRDVPVYDNLPEAMAA